MLDARKLLRDRRHVWPTVVGKTYRTARALLDAGLHVLGHPRTCVLGLPESAASLLAAIFFKGIHPSPVGDGLVLAMFLGRRPQGRGHTTFPG